MLAMALRCRNYPPPPPSDHPGHACVRSCHGKQFHRIPGAPKKQYLPTSTICPTPDASHASQCNGIRDRSKSVELWSGVAQYCLLVGNYNSATAILESLESPAIARLQTTVSYLRWGHAYDMAEAPMRTHAHAISGATMCTFRSYAFRASAARLCDYARRMHCRYYQ